MCWDIIAVCTAILGFLGMGEPHAAPLVAVTWGMSIFSKNKSLSMLEAYYKDKYSPKND